MSAGVDHLELPITGMTCASCANRIERRLNKLDGVAATVNYATEKARVEFDPTPDPSEVVEWAWVDQDLLRVAVRATPFVFSPWLVGQLEAWRA